MLFMDNPIKDYLESILSGRRIMKSALSGIGYGIGCSLFFWAFLFGIGPCVVSSQYKIIKSSLHSRLEESVQGNDGITSLEEMVAAYREVERFKDYHFVEGKELPYLEFSEYEKLLKEHGVPDEELEKLKNNQPIDFYRKFFEITSYPIVKYYEWKSR